MTRRHIRWMGVVWVVLVVATVITIWSLAAFRGSPPTASACGDRAVTNVLGYLTGQNHVSSQMLQRDLARCG